MLYPTAIMQDSDSAYGVIVPDLPGCFSAGDTFDEALTNSKEAIAFFLEDYAESGKDIPVGSSPSKFINSPDYKGAIWIIVEFDITLYLGKSVKVNVTLPELLIRKIDDRVSKDPTVKSRSGFLQQAALHELESRA